MERREIGTKKGGEDWSERGKESGEEGEEREWDYGKKNMEESGGSTVKHYHIWVRFILNISHYSHTVVESCAHCL